MYGGVTALTRLISLVVLPIIARELSLSDFAILDNFKVLCGLFISLGMLGLNQAVARHIADDKVNDKEIITQGTLFSLAFTVLLTTALFFSAEWLVELYFGDLSTTTVNALKVALLFIPVTVLFNYCQMLLKWHFKRKQFVILSFSYIIAYVALTYVALVIQELGLVGMLYVELIVAVSSCLLGLYFCREYFQPKIRGTFLKSLLLYGLPLMSVGVIQTLIPSLDRFFITSTLGLESLALYAMAFRISRVIQIPIYGMEVAWGPFAFSIYRSDDSKDTFVRVLSVFATALALLICTFLLVLKPVLIFFATEKYLDSLHIVTPFLLALYVDGVRVIVNFGVFVAKKTIISTYSYIIQLVMTLLFIYLLIVDFELLGVAYALLFGKVVSVYFEWYFANKYFAINFNFVLIISLFFAIFGFAHLIENTLWLM